MYRCSHCGFTSALTEAGANLFRVHMKEQHNIKVRPIVGKIITADTILV